MARALTLNHRSATWATLFFLLFVYQAQRAVGIFTGRFDGMPHVAAAPSWARVGFHAAIGTVAVALCAKWAFRAIHSLDLRITPRLTADSARTAVAGRWLSNRLPPAPEGSFTVKLNRLSDWRWWSLGAGLFLVTALPYWLLLGLVGHLVALGPLYLVLQAGHHLPWWIVGPAAVAGIVGLAVRRRRARGLPAADKPALLLLAFLAGSEDWSAGQRWRACLLYSLWLQKRGVFPFLTLLTAVPAQRLIMGLYHREIEAGRSPDEALSHILTLRTARIGAAMFFYAVVAVINFWPYIW